MVFSLSFSSLIGSSCLLLGAVSAQAIDLRASCTTADIGSKIAGLNNAVHVNFVQYVPAGTNLTFPNDPTTVTCSRASYITTVDFCRVAMLVTTSSISNVTVESWLPQTWSGRYLSTGNGGLNGCIDYVNLNYGVTNGFSTMGQNNGHNGTGGSAFYEDPGTVEDYSFRALHTGTIVGKQITNAFYSKEYTKSYYLGCSTGGRQGFRSAQIFPNDFDGIVAGAPAFDFNHLNAWSAHFYILLGPINGTTFIPVSSWPAIHQEILNQCDGLDGAVDGIIEDPELCYPRAEALICASAGATNCLTGAQAATLRSIYQPLYGLNGTMLYPRMQPGAELGSVGLYYSGNPFPYTVDFWRYAVYNDLSLTANNWSLSLIADVDSRDSTELFNVSSFNPDLTNFQQAGGKLIHYHGQADWLITSANSPRYYNLVSETMGLNSAQLDNFYRFFRISGMGHCSGGPGAWHFGQSGTAVSTMDLEDNVLLQIVAWVERNNPPETIRGTKYINDLPSEGVAFRRKHCKYPARNMYVGPGNYTHPSAWQCVTDSF